MAFEESRVTVHYVEGRPWKEAIISVLEPRSAYRPWTVDDPASIEEGDKVIAVLDTDPVSVLAVVGVVGADGDVQAAFAGIDEFRLRGLLEQSTLHMITPWETVVETLGGYLSQDFDACFGRSTLAQGRTLLASRGRCTGCDGRIDLTGPDAQARVHIHTADPAEADDDGEPIYTDWPAVLCETCSERMSLGGFTSFTSFIDFRFSLAPACPSCSGRRAMSTSYGRPSGGRPDEPWITSGGCVATPVDWVCGVCRLEW